MALKNLGVAAILLGFGFSWVAVAAQTGNSPSAASSPAKPAASPAPPPTANIIPRSDCQGSGCDATPAHITIATPAPAPSPWPLQERITWVANLILVLIIYFGAMLGIPALRKIARQMKFIETTAQAAADSAKAALMYAEAQAQSQRPWLVVSTEAEPGPNNRFTISATNRGRSPTRIVTMTDTIAIAQDEADLPATPIFQGEPKAPRIPIILLPGESTELKTFSRDDVKSVCETAEDMRRVEQWEAKVFLYGEITYVDLRAPADKEPYETGWCCWYIHGQQKSGMVIAGSPEYNRHT
ncbi:MAG TPA: hypothetical protein VGG45_20245 [Terracidiphilus sp.]|jgi:hypothetical protein